MLFLVLLHHLLLTAVVLTHHQPELTLGLVLLEQLASNYDITSSFLVTAMQGELVDHVDEERQSGSGPAVVDMFTTFGTGATER